VKRVLVVGEPLIELLEEPVGTIRHGFGGDALNLAVYLARESAELHVMLASAVGDDLDSDALLSLCRAEGVDHAHIRRMAGATLGMYRVTVDRSGERSFEYRRSQSSFRGALDGDGALPDHAAVDVLCFSGITVAVLHDTGRRNLLEYATAVHGSGGMIVYDPNHRPALWGDRATAVGWTQRIAPLADLVLASVDDGRELAGREAAAEIAAVFREMGALEVVVTDGPRPCGIAFDGRVEEVEVQPAPRVIDTTAAGDAFDAGYLASRLHGSDPVASAAAGHRLAARVVAHRGAIVPMNPRP
jgi:2-dehydro-3-deoxygluconokinase